MDKDERRKAFSALARKIGAMSAEERGRLAAKLPAIATVEGRVLSPFNQCLLAAQCPTATVVGGFRQWIAAGRAVRKGVHGMAIWIPRMPKADDNAQPGEVSDHDEVRFLLGTVFDVSQTEENGKYEPITKPEEFFQSQDRAEAQYRREHADRAA